MTDKTPTTALDTTPAEPEPQVRAVKLVKLTHDKTGSRVTVERELADKLKGRGFS